MDSAQLVIGVYSATLKLPAKVNVLSLMNILELPDNFRKRLISQLKPSNIIFVNSEKEVLDSYI